MRVETEAGKGVPGFGRHTHILNRGVKKYGVSRCADPRGWAARSYSFRAIRKLCRSVLEPVRRGFVHRVDKPMGLHNNFADVGIWYVRTKPVRILNG